MITSKLKFNDSKTEFNVFRSLTSAPKSTVTLHPGHTTVIDVSTCYSLRYPTASRAQTDITGSDYGSILILPQALELRDR